MNLLFGTAVIGGLSLLLLTGGYTVAGFLPAESRLTRFAIASLAGLAWLILGVSVWGAVGPLNGAAGLLLVVPAVVARILPPARRQLQEDLGAAVRSSHFYAAFAGLLLFGGSLLLPFFVHPDLVFFDGTANHDSFFWCSAAEFLQGHSYLSVAPSPDRDHPFFNGVGSILGLHPLWGRMGAEGFLALIGSAVRRPPVEIYNFAVCSLALPWLLVVLAAARRLGLPDLKPGLLLLVCLCQPVLAFFIANGNLPNLLGAIFGGGLWLVALLLLESGGRRAWPLVATGTLCVHGVLCAYPEILPFALLPVGLLAVQSGWRKIPGKRLRTLPLAGAVAAGFLLNPVTTMRAWTGFWASVESARLDGNWTSAFAKLNAAEYVPGFVTLAMPAMQVYGMAGGILATACVLYGGFHLIRRNARPAVLVISLTGFFTLLGYTLATSFSYGWQKAVQFSGIPMAVMFPVLLAGATQESFRAAPARWLIRVAWLATLAIIVHGTLGHTADNLKWSGRKGLTRGLLALGGRVAQDFPGQPVYCDETTFPFPFFHSMWSARSLARNPLFFLPAQEQPGGYLHDSVNRADPNPLDPDRLYLVDAEWARAFDYAQAPLLGDRLGVLVRKHNRVTAMRGFYRPSGVPEWTEDRFALTIRPYADGWLEFVLRPNGATAPGCRLVGRIDAGRQTENLEARPDSAGRLIVRFPLKAGVPNHLQVRIEGAPDVARQDDESRRCFEVLAVRSSAAAPE